MWLLFGLFFMFLNFYQLDLHNKTPRMALANYNETCAKIGSKIGSLLIQLWLLEDLCACFISY